VSLSNQIGSDSDQENTVSFERGKQAFREGIPCQFYSDTEFFQSIMQLESSESSQEANAWLIGWISESYQYGY
jgi:hypothetical protein